MLKWNRRISLRGAWSWACVENTASEMNIAIIMKEQRRKHTVPQSSAQAGQNDHSYLQTCMDTTERMANIQDCCWSVPGPNIWVGSCRQGLRMQIFQGLQRSCLTEARHTIVVVRVAVWACFTTSALQPQYIFLGHQLAVKSRDQANI
jgi:hypothetical protein